MPYAIVGYFDNETDLFIKSLWKELADNNICNYLYNSENNPHIKFSMHTELDVEKVNPILCGFANNHNKLTLHLKNYGFFSNENPTLVIDFAPSISLIKLENDIQRTFSIYGKNYDFNYFDENVWMPNCQLTVKSECINFQEAINILLQRPLQFNGVLDRLGVIEFHPAKQITSYKLR